MNNLEQSLLSLASGLTIRDVTVTPPVGAPILASPATPTRVFILFISDPPASPTVIPGTPGIPVYGMVPYGAANWLLLKASDYPGMIAWDFWVDDSMKMPVRVIDGFA